MRNIVVVLKASEVEGFKRTGDLLNKAGVSVDVVVVPDDRYDEAMEMVQSVSKKELEEAFGRVYDECSKPEKLFDDPGGC